MASADGKSTVAERLGRLLDRGLLPAGGPAEAAERLIERLVRPARVALLGLPGSGKSSILNLLAGSIVVPETLRLPTIIVQHGDVPQMHCTLSDGQTVTLAGSDLERVLPLSPALITLELDLPALKVISLLEVAAGPMEAEQRRAALWAGKRADILIWCSTAYLPKEQLVWEGMPDTYKDNGFLLLTKVDLLGGREAAAGMYHRVSQRASGEFRQVIAISAKEARAASPMGKPVDRERFRESGAGTVISTIKSRVQMAKQADTDTAELLLSRHSEAPAPSQRPKFELKAVEASTGQVLDHNALAAEAEALERIAAAAAQAVAEPAAPVDEPAPVIPEPEVPEPEVAELDPFPEPESAELIAPDLGTDEELTRGLRAILATTSEPAAPEPEETVRSANEDREVVAVTIEAEVAFVDDPVQDMPAILAEDAGIVEDPLPPVAEAEGPEAGPEIPLEAEENNQRFAARLKQISPESPTAPAGLVPLRATWKSRNDAVSAMPVVPKPEPNRNPTLRQLPESAARVVGRVTRPVEPEAPTVSPEPTANRAEGPAVEPNSGASREPDRKAGRITSVFASRSRPEPARDEPAAPADDAASLPQEEPTDDFPTITPVGESMAPPPELLVEPVEAEARAPVIPADIPDVKAGPEPEPLSSPEPIPDEAGQRLSERIRRPNRPVSVIRVSRLETPLPAPHDIVGPRMDNPRDTRIDTPLIERRERPRIAPRVTPSMTQPVSLEPTTLPASERVLLVEGIGLIAARAVELSDQIDPDDKPPLDLILEHCRETVDHVLTILSRGASPEIRRISTSLADFQDLIMLMRLEKGRAPADDALTLLLQLRREMETLSAG